MKNRIISTLIVVCFSLGLTVSAMTNQAEPNEKETVLASKDTEDSKVTVEEIRGLEELEVKEKSKKENSEKTEIKTETKKPEKVEQPVYTPQEPQVYEPPQVTETPSQPTQSNSSLGTFKLTAYCNCSICCGQWAGGATASGTMPAQGRTIAVDPSVIPLGTSVNINGNTYVAEDTGGAIRGNKIDIFFSSHSDAMNFGVQYAEVFINR